MSENFSEEELKILNKSVDGWYSHSDEEGKFLIFGSNTFPSYRITVEADNARRYIDGVMAAIVARAQAD